MDAERLRILQMIEDGQISASDGLRLIEALRQSAPPPPPKAGAKSDARPSPPPGARAAPPSWSRWQNWWLIPMWAGISLTTGGALLMYWAYSARFSFSGWFWLALLLVFAPGVAVMALAAASRQSKWLHVRIKNAHHREKLALSFPLPIVPAAWFLRAFGHRLPALRNTGVDELIMALGETTSPDSPLFVEVDGDDEGEKVQVYIG